MPVKCPDSLSERASSDCNLVPSVGTREMCVSIVINYPLNLDVLNTSVLVLKLSVLIRCARQQHLTEVWFLYSVTERDVCKSVW